MSETNLAPPTPPDLTTGPPEPDPVVTKDASARLKIGMTVRYTERVSGDHPQNAKRAAHPLERAAIVIFILDDGAERRPVLRVLNPMAPPMDRMPAEGVIHTGCGLGDVEVYAPKYNADPKVQNTWRHVE
jgi:hypothetical protein